MPTPIYSGVTFKNICFLYFPNLSSGKDNYEFLGSSSSGDVYIKFDGSYSGSWGVRFSIDSYYSYDYTSTTGYSFYNTVSSYTLSSRGYSSLSEFISKAYLIYTTCPIKDSDGTVLFKANAKVVDGYLVPNDYNTTPDYDTWYDNIFNGISDWIGGVLGSLVTPFEHMADGLSGVWSAVTDLPGDIADNIKDFFTDLGDKIEDVWDSVKTGFSNLGDKIVDLWNSVKDGFADVIDGIVNLPQIISDKIEYLFTPTVNIFALIKNKFENKFPIVSQISGLFDSLYNIGTTEPSFSFTYKGVNLKLIDFSSFAPYMPMIRRYTAVFIWLSFLSREVKRIPSLIRGRDDIGSSSEGDDTNVN